jgi:hypothetical protein
VTAISIIILPHGLGSSIQNQPGTTPIETSKLILLTFKFLDSGFYVVQVLLNDIGFLL